MPDDNNMHLSGDTEERSMDLTKPEYLGRSAQQRNSLGTASWAEPVDFADRHYYQEGDFWIIGRSPITDEPIGFHDDRHVLMASGTRSGKGASVIINNLCTWQGSLVVLDPKGENASVTAARRGAGSDYCEGLGQDVHVLDPFWEATVDEGHRSRYNPLDSIDMDGMRFNDEVMRIVSAIIVKEGSKDKFFDLSSQDLLRGLILHVKTYPKYEGRRNLALVRQLLSHGEKETADLLKDSGDEKPICPFDILWYDIAHNEAGGGIIAGIGKRIQSVKRDAPETYQGIFQNCLTETMFLDSVAIQKVTDSSDFALSDLKTKEQGVSVYLCLSMDDMEAYFKWLRVMITLITSSMIKTKGRPATGYQTLMCLDEFAGLQRMKIIEDSVAQLAGYGLKMFFVVQDFGQLKSIYKENWETFIGNSGLKLLFGQNDHLMTLKYISDVLGETEVSRQTRTTSRAVGTSETESTGTNENFSEAVQTGVTTGETKTHSKGNTRSVTDGKTSSIAQSKGVTHQKGKNWGSNDNWSINKTRQRGGGEGTNESTGDSESKQFETGDFGMDQMLQHWAPFRTDKSVAEARQRNRGSSRQTNWSIGGGTTRGGGRTEGGSSSISKNKNTTKTEGTSHSNTVGENEGFSNALSRQESHSETTTTSRGRTHQFTMGETHTNTDGSNEMLQARPLLTVNEMKKWFAPVSDSSSAHYPGYCLVMIADEDPTVVRRVNYFEDAHFLGWYNPHPYWPENAPPVFKKDIVLSGLPGSDALRIEWIIDVGDKTVKSEPIVKLGPYPYDGANPYMVEALEKITSPYVEVDSHREEFYWLVTSPQSGELTMKGVNPDEKYIGKIETNRRKMFFDADIESLPDANELFDDYIERIDEHVRSREEQEAQRIVKERLEKKRLAEERKRQEEEKRQKAEAEAERIAREAQEKKDRALKEAEEKERLLELQRQKDEKWAQRRPLIKKGIIASVAILLLAFIAIYQSNKQEEERNQILYYVEKLKDAGDFDDRKRTSNEKRSSNKKMPIEEYYFRQYLKKYWSDNSAQTKIPETEFYLCAIKFKDPKPKTYAEWVETRKDVLAKYTNSMKGVLSESQKQNSILASRKRELFDPNEAYVHLYAYAVLCCSAKDSEALKQIPKEELKVQNGKYK